jgi:ATP-dependent DNA ligase
MYSGKRAAVRIQPTLIAQVKFRAWTDDGKLEHAASNASATGRIKPTFTA